MTMFQIPTLKLQYLYIQQYTTPRKPNNFTENLIPKRVKLDDKYRGVQR